MEYLTLTIHIQGGIDAGTYPVRVETPRWGSQTGCLRVDTETLKQDIDALIQDDLGGDDLTRLGETLFATLFPRDVAVALAISYGYARGADKGLRVRIRVDPAELRDVPWELAYFPWWRRYLGCDVSLPLTRHVDAFVEARPLEAELPLNVLAIVPDGSQLNVDKEKENLARAFAAIGSAARLDLLDGKVTIDDIRDRLIARPYHILQYVGYGEYVNGHGFIDLHDAVGGIMPLRGDRLAALFHDHRSLRLAVLNACKGARAADSPAQLAGAAQYLSASGIPAVLAYQFPVQDRDAIDFSRWFYSSLTIGQHAGLVEAALAYARNQLSVDGRSGRAIGAPILYVREENGPLFTLKEPDTGRLRRLLATKESTVRALELEIQSRGYASDATQAELEATISEVADLRNQIKDAEALLVAIRSGQ